MWKPRVRQLVKVMVILWPVVMMRPIPLVDSSAVALAAVSDENEAVDVVKVETVEFTPFVEIELVLRSLSSF